MLLGEGELTGDSSLRCFMETISIAKESKKDGRRPGVIFAGAIVIGILMAWRHELSSTWMRVIVAACAGAVLGWMIQTARKKAPKK